MSNRRYLRWFAALVCLAALAVPSGPVAAQSGKKGDVRNQATQKVQDGPANYRSKNFRIRTDLPAAEARELLKRLETMLSLISRYWGRRNTRPIECYVVKDLDKWQPGSIDPIGLAKIRAGAGVTKGRVGTRGNVVVSGQAIVYAVAGRGTPLHEAVHAYCIQTFGRTGPVWYSEGMAEMGSYWIKDDQSVNAADYIVRYLRKSKPKSLNEIVNGKEFTGDSWQNYAWRWALCHMLSKNANYTDRFRSLGLGLLQNKRVSFQQVYGAMAKEIDFEYRLFLTHVERGYRVDLCSWDWKSKYRQLGRNAVLQADIRADRGWQPSRVLLKEGEEYTFNTTGTWKTSKDGAAVNVDGTTDGSGRLLGIVFNDYELSEPFELGVRGSFKAPSDGKLLLRCNDKWSSLADNSGKVTVRLRIKNGSSTPGS